MKIPLLGVGLLAFAATRAFSIEPAMTKKIPLPSPEPQSDVSVEQAMAERRSVRDFTGQALGIHSVGQLLWAAQGVTSSYERRTAPSAGALYPLEVYIVAGELAGLDPGVYQYRPDDHSLKLHLSGDVRTELARAARQAWVADAPVVVVIAAVYERTRKKYGARTERYVHMEVGHVAQNVYLQAESLGLGTVMVGAFRDAEIQTVLHLPSREAPLALMPVGHPE